MKHLLCILLVPGAGALCAQPTASPTLLASSTGNGVLPGVHIFWSAGETAIATLSGSPYTATQGFWQPEALQTTGTNAALLEEYGIQCFPNPVSDLLYISKSSAKPIRIALYSLEGRLLLTGTQVAAQQALSMTAYPAAVYWLRVDTDDGAWVQTLKIAKL
ncbi:MAG: T9SS type A sorting domain-containing protein [Saprospirales bacterium]|jgi:hypothetical protein|nr:T9SS type A sorting domain-containing protein [Saprospirales bacterium]MBK8922611.1 T9SS type A sorting domain-containing protein [Saprospirales bacterium]